MSEVREESEWKDSSRRTGRTMCNGFSQWLTLCTDFFSSFRLPPHVVLKVFFTQFTACGKRIEVRNFISISHTHELWCPPVNLSEEAMSCPSSSLATLKLHQQGSSVQLSDEYVDFLIHHHSHTEGRGCDVLMLTLCLWMVRSTDFVDLKKIRKRRIRLLAVAWSTWCLITMIAD